MNLKIVYSLFMGILLSLASPSFADLLDDHYKSALEDIQKKLRAQGVRVKSVTLGMKQITLGQAGANISTYVLVEVEGLSMRQGVPMPLQVGGKLLPLEPWVQTYVERWNERIMNLALAVPSEYMPAAKVFNTLADEVLSKSLVIANASYLLEQGLIKEGKYIQSLIPVHEELLRTQFEVMDAVKYVDRKGEKQAKLLWVSREFVMDVNFLKSRLIVVEDILAHHEKLLVELRIPVDGVTDRASYDNFIKERNQLILYKALCLRIQGTLNMLLKLHGFLKLEQGPGRVLAIEKKLVTEQLRAIRELQARLKLVMLVPKDKKTLEGPNTPRAMLYRNAVLNCQESLDKLAELGVEFQERSIVLENGSKILELQSMLEAQRALVLKDAAKTQALYTSVQDMGIRIQQTMSELTKEYERLRALDPEKLSKQEHRRLNAIQYDLPSLRVQLQEVYRMAELSRSLKVK